MKNKEENSVKKCTTEEKAHHCCAHKYKFVFLIIFVMLLCVVGEHFFNNNGGKLISTKKTDAMAATEGRNRDSTSRFEEIYEEVSKLKNEISNLKENLFAKLEYEKSRRNGGDMRKKWETWLRLKSKIEKRTQFDKELDEFRSEFSYDKELLEIVDKFTKNICLNKNNDNENGIVSFCKKYFCSIFRVKKLDYRELLDISGYVLSSVSGDEGTK